MDAGPVKVVSRDGTSIAAFVSGSGPPLVLVHGTTADHTRWAHVAPALAGARTVYAMDRRGRGASGDVLPYAIGKEYDDVAAVVAHAARASGGPVDLLGHSYGALCALGGALRTTHLRRLVLYEPPFLTTDAVAPPDVLARLSRLVADGRREEALVAFFRDLAHVPASTIETMRASPAWTARLASVHTIPRETEGEKVVSLDPGALARLGVPVLFLEGGASHAALTGPGRTLAKLVPGSRLVALPGQTHVAMDTAPDLFLGEVRAFLDG